MENTTLPKPKTREENFIYYLLEQIKKNKGLAARLRRADNPATEYQSWELLATFGIDLEKEDQRLPFVTIAASLSKAKIEINGDFKLGQAIAACYSDGNKNDQAVAKLRRVLACDSLPELCRILRPTLHLIASRVSQPLDYIRLLKQLRSFVFDQQRIKVQWAQEFYGYTTNIENIEEFA